jgi:hypothetical protein
VSGFPGNINQVRNESIPAPKSEHQKALETLQVVHNGVANELAQLKASREKLRQFLMENFKSETGNESPEDCAIRLLTKKKK